MEFFVLKQDRTIFAPDFQALSLFRIFFAAYLLGDYYVHLPFFADLYGDDGILPLNVLVTEPLAGVAVISPILHALENVGVRAVFPILYPAVLVAFGLGWRTRWAAAIVFVLNSYLFWRNPYVRNGAEYLAHLLLLWCLFLPMERYWSVDAALDHGSRERPYPVLPFLAMRLQISSLYFFAGLFKLASRPWIDGSALSWSLQDNIFGAQPAGLFLVHHFPGLLHAGNYAVIVFQLLFPFLIYCPWRNDLTRSFALIVAALAHISFIFSLTVGGFPYLCLVMLLLLVPDAWLTSLCCAIGASGWGALPSSTSRVAASANGSRSCCGNSSCRQPPKSVWRRMIRRPCGCWSSTGPGSFATSTARFI
jgi:HTTM domain